jgi:hypothetical protein
MWQKIVSLFKKTPVPQESKHERIRQLILQKVSPKMIASNRIDSEEAHWYHLRTRYKVACMFALAGKQPNQTLDLVNGDKIVTNAAQTNSSMKWIIDTREYILKEYQIDMEDLLDEK